MSRERTKKKGILAILSASIVFLSSIAFFTDSKANRVGGSLGTLTISTSVGYTDFLNKVAPGDLLEVDYGVSNDGSLDADIRHIYRLSVPEEDIDKYPIGGLSLHANGVEVVSVVNNDTYVPFGVLGAGDSESLKLEIGVDPSLVNDIQGHSFKLEILTEAKQLNSPDWVKLAFEDVEFGDNKGFKVVPSTNLIKTANDNILRSSIPEHDALGYVRFFTNKVSRYTASTLKDEFLNDRSVLNIYSPSGVLYGDNDIVETGALVKLESGGSSYDSLMFISIGDLDEDGSIIASDLSKLRSLLRISQGLDSGVIPIKDLLAADLDGDGRVTANDEEILTSYMRGEISEFPLHYPQTPYGVRKPDVSLSVGLNDNITVINGDEAWDLGVELGNGAEVSAGDIIKVAVNIDNLRNLDIFHSKFDVLFNKDYLEVAMVPRNGVPSTTPWRANFGDDYGLAPYSEWFTNYSQSTTELVNGKGVSLIANGSGMYRELDGVDSFLTGSGKHMIFALRVKDSVPSGTELDITFGDLDVVYEGFGDITYFDTWNSNSSFSLIVK